MRLAVFSDLHLEHRPPWSMPEALPPYHVAIVAGDIHRSCREAVEALAAMPALDGNPILFVPGNHEHYGGMAMQDNLADGIEAAKNTNVVLLHRDQVVIEGVRFIGATLWTDYALDGTILRSMLQAEAGLNDHRMIRYRDERGRIARFMPTHARQEHIADFAFLRATLAKPHEKQTVVITHHLPSRRSIAPRFANSGLNPAFASDLEALIEDTAPSLWVHGHTHHTCAYRIGATTIICNPKGYGPSHGGGLENGRFDARLAVQI